jgi:hypothetical protein
VQPLLLTSPVDAWPFGLTIVLSEATHPVEIILLCV